MYTPEQRLMRSRSDHMIGGVAGGIGRYLAIDPVVVRLVFVALTLFHGIGLISYLIMLVVMPREPRSATPIGSTEGSAEAQGEHAFVAYRTGARRARFDPMTGEPLNPEEEIPVQNLNGSTSADQDMHTRRSWVLGIILLVVGVFFVLRMLMPDIAPFAIPALLIGAGIVILSYNRSQ
jgi:phage shock protein C